MGPTTVRRRPTPAERAIMEEQARRWAGAMRSRLSSPWEMGVPALLMLGAGAVLIALGHGVGPWLGAAGGMAAGAALGMAWRNHRFVPAPSPYPLDDDVDEHTARPSRAVFAVDDRGDGQLWCLLLLEDGWFVLSSEDLPWEPDLDLVHTLAHAEVRWVRTATGLPLTVTGRGASIPARGIPTSLEHPSVDAAIAAGWCWSPPDDLDDAPIVPADALPPWVTDPSVDPEPLAPG